MTPTTPAASLGQRWQKLVIAGEIIWVLLVLMQLATAAAGPIYPLRNDYLGFIVDVPDTLIPNIRPAGGGMAWPGSVHQSGTIAGLSFNLMSAVGYQLMVTLASLSAILAAVRGRWGLHLALLALMLIPPFPFGAGLAIFPGPIIILSAFIAGWRAVKKQCPRTMIPVLVASALTLVVHGVYHGMSLNNATLVLFRQDVREAAQQTADMERALSAMPASKKPAADYVRAQVAYIQKDWPRLKAIGPIDPRGWTSSPYKNSRIAVINEAVRQLANGTEPTAGRSLLWSIMRGLEAALWLTGLGLTLTNGWLKRRLKRIDSMAAELTRLRRLNPL